MGALIKGFVISIVLFSAALTASFFYLFISNIKLNAYLKKEKYDRWRELTTVWNFGPGGINSFRGFPYLFSKIDNEDQIILRYKDRIRFGLRLSLFMLLALILNLTILVVMFKAG